MSIKCDKCAGTGKWPSIKDPEATHFTCKGTGILGEMTEKQYSFIRVLFKKMVALEIISDSDQETMVQTMLGHRNGLQVKSVVWASDKIEEYKSRINRFNSSKSDRK